MREVPRANVSQPPRDADPAHCAFCWKKFYVQADEPGHRDERKYLQYGFRTDDGNTWVCEECYYAIRDVLEFAAEVS
jgi:hypothetical protein